MAKITDTLHDKLNSLTTSCLNSSWDKKSFRNKLHKNQNTHFMSYFPEYLAVITGNTAQSEGPRKQIKV
jgi:primosomal protein N''